MLYDDWRKKCAESGFGVHQVRLECGVWSRKLSPQHVAREAIRQAGIHKDDVMGANRMSFSVKGDPKFFVVISCYTAAASAKLLALGEVAVKSGATEYKHVVHGPLSEFVMPSPVKDDVVMVIKAVMPCAVDALLGKVRRYVDFDQKLVSVSEHKNVSVVVSKVKAVVPKVFFFERVSDGLGYSVQVDFQGYSKEDLEQRLIDVDLEVYEPSGVWNRPFHFSGVVGESLCDIEKVHP